jgi:peptide/nickel transport system permease protein
MSDVILPTKPQAEGKSGLAAMLSMLWRDKLAFVSALMLILILLCALLGPTLLGEVANDQNLRGRNFAPFSFDRGLAFFFGGDSLGRPMLPRLVVAARSTILVASGAVLAALMVGATLGLVAGYLGKGVSQTIMRLADVIMSFPSLLIAVVVLYVLGPSIPNMILVLAITRIPIYLRTTRAEVLEVRERMFVQAAVVMGAGHWRIIARHILPVVAPTLVTIATLDFAFVMLAESSLSFLGIGIQPPDITWGLMVSQGRPYLTTAWWLALWPGLFIVITTLALNLLSNWMRVALDPAQRWRLEARSTKDE